MQQLQGKTYTLFQKGMAAYRSQNWDYAIALFTAVLEELPDFAPARKQLRLSEFNKFDKLKFRFLRKIFSHIPSIKILICKWRKKWMSIVKILEKRLISYPKNYRLLKQLAIALEKLDFPESACGTYEAMYILKPTDKFVLKKLGKFYNELGQPEKARSFYKRASVLDPSDYEVKKGLQDLAALGTIDKGWGKEGTYRDKIKDKKQADIFEKESRIVHTEEDKQKLISDIETRLKKQPENITLIKKLGSLYLAAKKYNKALELLKEASEIDSSDINLRKEILNIKLLMLKKEGSKQKQKELTLEYTKNLVKEFPSHLPIRYELGVIYMEHHMWDKAIAEFQISVKAPKLETQSLNKLGLCFYNKKIYDLAINQFKKAAENLHGWDSLKKEIVYNLGTVYESMGQKQKAQKEYKKIYEQDISYKDISKKIS